MTNQPPVDLNTRGLRLTILRPRNGDCSNGGLSGRVDHVTVVGTQQRPGLRRDQPVKPLPREAQVFAPTLEAPAVVMRESHLRGHNEPFLVPLAWVLDGVPPRSVGPMFGGCFATTSDSRFAEIITDEFCADASALRIHDRVESPELYRAMSSD